MQGLLQLPPEVVGMIINSCDTQALLQLRLVSKNVKTIVDSSTRFKDALGIIQINLHTSTLKNFVESAPSLPFTNFCIDLSLTLPIEDLSDWQLNHFFWNNPHMRTFKEKFCPQIRKLRLSAMFCGTIDAELDFFRRLESLEDLEIQKLQVFRPIPFGISSEYPEFQKKPPRLPCDGKTNVSLKRLAVDVEDNSEEYLVDWIKLCPRIETLRVPTSAEDGTYDSSGDLTLVPYVLTLGAGNHLQHLKNLDFNRHSFYNGTTIDIDECSDEERRFFQEFVARRNLRLENVSSPFLSSVLNDPDLPEECKQNFQDRIVSWNGLSEFMKHNELKNVEEVCFSFERAELIPEGMEWTHELTNIRLPALKKISGLVLFEGGKIDEAQDFTDSLFRPDEPRSTVTELDVEYQTYSFLEEGVRFVRITPEYFDASFPNLRKLKLKLDSFTRRELCVLVQAISRKEFLEELSLSTPKGIPEAAFFGSGNSNESPLSLRLQNLKKLRLDSEYNVDVGHNYERMGNRTLRLLSRMNLTHLHIIGRGWNDVTIEGIRALVDGPFGQSVLWLRLTRVEDSLLDSAEHREMMERVCHRNRLGKGLTSSSSFEQFKASEEALVGGNHPFRTREWRDANLHWSF